MLSPQKYDAIDSPSEGARFQRMMDWGLRDPPCAEPYLNDVIVGSTGSSVEEIISNNHKFKRYKKMFVKKLTHRFSIQFDVCNKLNISQE